MDIKPLSKIPQDIVHALSDKTINLTPLSEMNNVLNDDALQREAGYRPYGNGNWQVSMYCPMPGITPEMIRWWFWWHPKENVRYQIWFPSAHKSIGYANKDKAYFQSSVMPDFQPNVQYPRETIGGMTATLKIAFVTPEDFGFSRNAMEQNDIPIIVCGHVGLKGLFFHTEMAHVFKSTSDGLFMFSRFWLGEPMKQSPVKKLMMTEKMARGMAEHCCIEYRNLVEILPSLYSEYRK